MMWYLDHEQIAAYGRWLSHRRYLMSGEDTWQFVEDPRKWERERLAGDLRAEYEAERRVAA